MSVIGFHSSLTEKIIFVAHCLLMCHKIDSMSKALESDTLNMEMLPFPLYLNIIYLVYIPRGEIIGSDSNSMMNIRELPYYPP